MPPAIQVTDALWHCLCPSFPRQPAIKSIRQAQRVLRPCVIRRAVSTTHNFNSNSNHAIGKDDEGNAASWRPMAGLSTGDQSFFNGKGSYRPSMLEHEEDLSPELQAKVEKMGLTTQREVALYKKYLRVGKTALYNFLDSRALMADIMIVRMIVKMLVEERGEEMDARLYSALVLANANGNLGSAEEVERLLKDMEANAVPADSDVFHAALKALSIHPDHLLRNSIIEKLQQYWFPLSRDGWQWYIVGLIRDKQIEVALEKFKEMQELGFEMDGWFLNFVTTTLLSTSAFPEALAVLKIRCSMEEPVSSAFWDHCLTTAAQSFAYPIVDFVWKRAVAHRYLNPSSGTCTDVLAVAARNGDYRLATDVFRILGQRFSPIYPHHYESLCESYLSASDLATALSVLSIMASTSTPPTEASASSLYTYLLRHPRFPSDALDILKEQRKLEKPVAIATINSILNVLGQFRMLDAALDVYNTLDTYIPEGPNTSTFNALLRGCSTSSAKNRAMFLAAEMRARKIQPDALTYDRLILICTKGSGEDDVSDAFKYWEEMCRRGWWPRPGTVVSLAKALVGKRDQAVWRVLQENAKRGMNSMALRRWVNENWPAGKSEGDRMESDRPEGEVKQRVKFEETPEEIRRRRQTQSLMGRGGKDVSKEELAQWDNLG